MPMNKTDRLRYLLVLSWASLVCYGFSEATRNTQCQGLNGAILGLAYVIPYVTGCSFQLGCKRSRSGCYLTMHYLLLDTLNMSSSLHNNFCHLVTLKPSRLLENVTIFVIWRRIVLGFSMHSDICWGDFAVGLSWRWALRHVPSDGSTSSFNWRGIAIAEFSTSRFENIQGPWSTIVCLVRSFFVQWFNAVKYMV